MEMKCDIKDISLAEQGENNINWAIKDMPVLSKIRARFEKERPFEFACYKRNSSALSDYASRWS